MMEVQEFYERIELIAEGICPACQSLSVIAECTDESTNEWTITCSKCDYLLVFAGGVE